MMTPQTTPNLSLVSPYPLDLTADKTTTYDIAVVVVNWNVKDLLRNCLESLRKAVMGLAVRVVVVDNASSDGSAEMVESLFPEVELVRNQTNAGFARANNQGLERYQKNSRFLLLSTLTLWCRQSAFTQWLGSWRSVPRPELLAANL